MDDGPGEAPPIALLAAVPDAEPRAEPLHRFANNPYVVFGRAYTPQREVQAFRQRGVGSWYGRKFHGQPTATGEAYDMYAMTAAHPTLPLPSYARVTNVANGRSVIVRVNDRGPFLHERVIDLSYTAAWKLGYLEQGSAHVEVETIVPGTSIAAGARRPTFGEAATASFASASATSGRMRVTLPPAQPAEGGSTVVAPAVPRGVAATAPSVPAESTPSAAGRGTSPLLPVASEANGVFLQLGAFSARENAEAFRAHVARMLPWVTDPINLRPSRGLVRVQLGPYADAIEAMAMAERIRNALDVRPVVTR
jgi:rare lipoprotein A